MTGRSKNLRVRELFVAAASAASLTVLLLEPPISLQLVVLAPLLGVLGLPHGALDLKLAQAVWPLEGLLGFARFVSAYLSLAGLVIVLWWFAPSVAMVAFLSYSAAHFSEDWRGELDVLSRGMMGVAVISLPALAGRDDVAVIFEQLSSDESASVLASALQALGLCCLIGLAAIVVQSWRRGLDLSVELIALAVIALAAPPLVYFAIYFCLLHSPRHFLSAARALNLGWRAALGAAMPLSVVTIAVAAGAAFALHRFGLAGEAIAVKIVFIGLAALTVPHMLLVDRFWKTTRTKADAELRRSTAPVATTSAFRPEPRHAHGNYLLRRRPTKHEIAASVDADRAQT